MASEKRLIDANDLLNAIRDDYNINGAHFSRIRRHIEDAPAVDAVEVVRCRECFYYTPVDKNTGKCAFLIGAHQYAVPDGYCYLGERKEGAD